MNPYEPPDASSEHLSRQSNRGWKGFGLFRYRLARLPYAAILLIHYFSTSWLIDGKYPHKFLLVYLSMPLLLVLAVLPRVRDCGWPWWVSLTTMIPYVGSFSAFGLFFLPTKVTLRKNDSDVPESPLGSCNAEQITPADSHQNRKLKP